MRREYKQYYKLIGLTTSILITINLINHQTYQHQLTINNNDHNHHWIEFYQQQSSLTSKSFIILLITIWLGFLFSFVGIVASDFFCPNLSTISIRLGLSENLAGVTLLGFGNGAPDVFSTFAAIKANTGSLAIGELIGAASFIISIVVGSMSIIRPFKLPKHSFLRDISFFIIAIIFVIIIIQDQLIHRWQANTLILIYLIYVLTVLISSYSIQRKQIKLDQLHIARNQYNSNQLLEAYLDEPDLPTPQHQPLIPELNPPNTTTRPGPLNRLRTSSSSQSQDSFQSLLESSCYPLPVRQRRMRAPSLSYRPGPIPANNILPTTSPNHSFSNLPPPPPPPPPQLHSTPSQDGMSSPELNRRRRRNTILINPFRPSLLGAIEFRDVVNSLAHQSTARCYSRPHSPAHDRRSRSASIVVGPRSPINPHRTMPTRSDSDRPRRKTEFALPELSPGGELSSRPVAVAGRHRLTHSQGSIVPPISHPFQFNNTETTHDHHDHRESIINLSSTPHSTFSPIDQTQSQPSQTLVSPMHKPSTPLPSILITSDQHEILALPDSPNHSDNREHHRVGLHGMLGDEDIGWRILASTVWETLFPTLKDWAIKSLLGKAIALISAPAVLVLTLTLPVVDETEEGLEDDSAEIDLIGIGDDDAEEEVVEEEEESVEEDVDGCALGMTFSDSKTSGLENSRRAWTSNPHSTSSSGHQSDPNPVSYPMVDVGTGSNDGLERRLDGRAESEMVDNQWPHINPCQAGFSRQHIARLLASVQSFLSPLFWKVCLQDQSEPPKALENLLIDLKISGHTRTWEMTVTLACLALGLIQSLLVFRFLAPHLSLSPLSRNTKVALCLLGFVNSMLWILTIVDQVIEVLSALASIFGIQHAVLGLTIFAIGNSLGDLVANLTLAKMGFPVMAVSACFGGPLLNILLGIGLSSSIVMTTRGTTTIPIETSSPILLFSAIALLILLVAIAILVPFWKHFAFDRSFGAFLFFAYLFAVGGVFVVHFLT